MIRAVFLFLSFAFVSVDAKAVDILDLNNSMQSWSLRWSGYRSYRLEVPVNKESERCFIGVTAHVNPKVKDFTVLLMGMGSDRWACDNLLKHYKDHPSYSSFILLDWPHHGDTDCPDAKKSSDVVKVIARALEKFGRPIERIVGTSMGSIPAALLHHYYPAAQQVWITPPFLRPELLPRLKDEVMAISSESEVQAFLNKTMTKMPEVPTFVLRALLGRIERSQIVLKNMSIKKIRDHVFGRRYDDLLIVFGTEDKLLPFSELDPGLQDLTNLKIQTLPCGHDIIRRCGEDVKTVMEASRRARKM